MINDSIYIMKYDWNIDAYYIDNNCNVSEIIDNLKSIGCDYQRANDVYNLVLTDDINTGVTYSNHILHKTIMIISKATSPKEFINTFVHELRHIENHITKTFNLDNNSEEVCYLIGDIAEQLYDKIQPLLI